MVDKRVFRHSISNINLHKCHKVQFYASSYHLRYLYFKFFTLKFCQGHVVEKETYAIRWLVSNSIKVVLEHFFARSHLLPAIVYLYNSRNCVTLKILVKIIMYNIRNDAIRWLVLTSIKVLREHFSLALAVFQILHIYIFPEIL